MIVARDGPGPLPTLTFKLDESAKVKAIDFADGKKSVPGIYLLDGDTLKLCLPLDRPAERPTEAPWSIRVHATHRPNADTISAKPFILTSISARMIIARLEDFATFRLCCCVDNAFRAIESQCPTWF